MMQMSEYNRAQIEQVLQVDNLGASDSDDRSSISSHGDKEHSPSLAAIFSNNQQKGLISLRFAINF